MLSGGGIVFDSVEEDEYIETINKLASNVKCIEEAESEPFLWLLATSNIMTFGAYYRFAEYYARQQSYSV